MSKFTEPAVDMYLPHPTIVYPKTEAKLKYDFLFTRKGEWFYINSSNDLTAFNGQKKVAANGGEKWVIVEPQTGEIIKSS